MCQSRYIINQLRSYTYGTESADSYSFPQSYSQKERPGLVESMRKQKHLQVY